jgi:hypothetical protein
VQRSQPVRRSQFTMNSTGLPISQQYKSPNNQFRSQPATSVPQQFYPVEPLGIKQVRPLSQNRYNTRPFTAQTVQPVTTILQPKPTRPIPISRLTHASQPANVIPIRKVLDQRATDRQNTMVNHGNPVHNREQTVPFHFQPATIHPRDVLRDANATIYPNQGARAFIPMGQAIRRARATQELALRAQAEPINPTSPQYDVATDSGYEQAPAQSFHHSQYAAYPQRTSTPAPQGGVTIYCGTGTQESPQPDRNVQENASVWNPNLANCTATKPRRLTLKQDNDFEEADRKHRAEDMRNSISVVKISMEARNKPHSNQSQRPGPVSASQQERRGVPTAHHRF